MQYAQGDVFITKLNVLPKNLKPVALEHGAIVLAHGEVTGHKHQITTPKRARLLVAEKRTADDELLNVRFLEIMESCEIVHEEHSTITLAPGFYEVRQQREWTDANEPMRVAD
jgi:hypothetical protein